MRAEENIATFARTTTTRVSDEVKGRGRGSNRDTAANTSDGLLRALAEGRDSRCHCGSTEREEKEGEHGCEVWA